MRNSNILGAHHAVAIVDGHDELLEISARVLIQQAPILKFDVIIQHLRAKFRWRQRTMR